jgi:hypothetical protein
MSVVEIADLVALVWPYGVPVCFPHGTAHVWYLPQARTPNGWGAML